MNLIIRDELLEPPTELYCFRDLTLYSTVFLKYTVLVETQDKDAYWNMLRKRACHDFVRDLVRYDEEKGVCIQARSSPTSSIVVPSISAYNLSKIIQLLPKV